MSNAIQLGVNIGGLAMKNPVTVASGTFGSGKEYAQFYELCRLGAVTTKGTSLAPWTGNPSPRIAETSSGMLNSIGLQNPGVDAFISDDLAWLKTQNVPVIVNVSGHSEREYTAVIERLEEHEVVSAYEVNISCPNVDAGGMTFGADHEVAARVVAGCRAVTKRPLIVKLTPNVTNIAHIASAVEAAGADALSMINTLLALAIDIKTRRPKLARGVGGLSGPAVKPIAVRMVHQTYQAVDIPIIGMGGIQTADDAIEFMLAGATAISVGTANFIDPYTPINVIEGIEAYCKTYGVSDVGELVGAFEM